MKSRTALIERFKASLNDVPPTTRASVNRIGGLSEDALLGLIINPYDSCVDGPHHPQDSIIEKQYDADLCFEFGQTALQSGEVAYCILAGGVGTRIGEPKALLRLPNSGMSLLTLKLFQANGTGPIWILTSPSLRAAVESHVFSIAGIDLTRIQIVEQYESYRLTPDNQIFFSDGVPNLYPCGHGDIFPALTTTGILRQFINAGGKYVAVVNADNILASLDPFIVGRHIICNANVSCEVVERSDEDAGGVLCIDRGQLQIVESYRIRNVNAKEFKWLNTNSLIFNANLNVEPLGNSWNRVQKIINDNVVIQHERLLQEITEAYDTFFFKSERSERFFPIKNSSDLIAADKKVNVKNIL
jgi:UTP--glucose-1-phosphate uridylyltransferase